MELGDAVIRVAKACSKNVFVPDDIGCCAFAGDKGSTHPELNAWARRKLRDQSVKPGVSHGYSNSRTCEIGLTTHSGVPYSSIVSIVNKVASPK
jgi:D-lactate dehydrogenase